MPTPSGLPIVDHHCHLAPTGEGVAAARRFAAHGGTHLFLATQAYAARPPMRLEEYAAQFATTEQLASAVRAEVGIEVYVVLAPFPVDLVQQVPVLGADAALDLHRGALELAGRRVRERAAVALGEVGWPHFETDPAVGSCARSVFRIALDTARDVDCALQVHSPDLDPEGYRSLQEVAAGAGVAPARVVKHYARTPVATADRAGLAASYVATREIVESALPQSAPWFLETDFLDDPRRPGAVLDLATVPRRAAAIASRGGAAEERLRIPFEISVRAVYGFTPEVRRGGP